MKGDGTANVWRDFLPLSAVFAIGLAFSFATFAAVQGYYQTQARQQFRRVATYYGTSFKDDVARHVTSLAAIRAFVSASKGMTRWEFSIYAHQILPQNLGLRGVLWVPRISRQDRAAYEVGLQQDGLYGLRIRQLTAQGEIVAAGDRQSYLPISYVEPFDGNDNLVGLDLSPLASFEDLFRVARQTGQVAASPPMYHTLVAGTRGPTVLLAFPLSSGAPGAETGSNANVAPQGYAIGVLQLQTLISEAIGPSAASVQVAIGYQDTSHSPLSVLTSDKWQSAETWFKEATFRQTMPFDIAGRHFLLVLRSTDHADVITQIYVPLGAALLVAALTTLLMQNMLTTIRRKRLVERAVVERTAELTAANKTLRGEVEQRRRAEAELRVARDRAESASRAKSSFMASMSHELRTPLNAIIGFSSILADNPTRPSAQQTEYAGEILASGKRLLALINDILDLTQMDAHLPNGDDALIYLNDCVAAVVQESMPAAQAAGVLLKSSVPDNLPALHGDGKRLIKAISHLVSNAIKFTPHGGAAAIAAEWKADTLILDVTDTGVGMSPQARTTMLQAFSQHDDRLGRKYDGVGLGLTYVRKVAELHRAELDIVSEPGKGTCVRLTFHLQRVAEKQKVA